MRALDLTGQRFGRLLAIEVVVSVGKKRKWRCVCDCGKISVLPTSDLSNGRTKSCGCLTREVVSALAVRRNTVHGHNKVGLQTLTHKSWVAMLSRCRDSNHISYQRYGGRGITVCTRWLNFENFLDDMGDRPSAEYSIDRIDADGNYEKGNCRWSTRSEQQKNKGDKKNKNGLTAFLKLFPLVSYSPMHIQRMITSGMSFSQIEARAKQAGKMSCL